MTLNDYDETKKSLEKIENSFRNEVDIMTLQNIPGMKDLLFSKKLTSNRAMDKARKKISKEVDLDTEELFEDGMKVKNENPDISKRDLTIKIFEKLANDKKNKTLSKLAKDILKEGRL